MVEVILKKAVPKVAIFQRTSLNHSCIYVFQVTLDELTEESKLSISAHIHRDGGVHFGLTDKTAAGRSDQLTFLAPET